MPRYVTLALALLLLATSPALAQDRSLYERLGRYDAIAAVVDDFVGRLDEPASLVASLTAPRLAPGA